MLLGLFFWLFAEFDTRTPRIIAEARSAANFKDADEIHVAVLDTGIDPDHPDLAREGLQYIHVYPDVRANGSREDIIGHGTHVAGTICARFDNELGINGICRPKLSAYKIFDDQPTPVPEIGEAVYFVNPAMYLAALAACLEDGVDVINLSIGGGGEPDGPELQLFNALLDAGVTVVAAMGNERRDGSPTSYPAAIAGVIAVGATTINDRVASFSNSGQHISLGAPGAKIWSTLPTYAGQSGFELLSTSSGWRLGEPFSRETDYDAWDGTSMATPHVSAAAALLLAREKLSPADVREQLMSSADKVESMRGAEFHPDFGAGRLNLARLLAE